jgi:hypothetical protein
MGIDKLRLSLCQAIKGNVTLEETEKLLQSHKEVYRDYWKWVFKISNNYKAGYYLQTNDNFVLFPDNDRMTSVRNFLVQGNAASITRLAVVKAIKLGLQVIAPLHDAIYMYSEQSETEHKLLERCMLEATAEILEQPLHKVTMRMDTKIIGSSQLLAEEKGVEDWKTMSKLLGEPWSSMEYNP